MSATQNASDMTSTRDEKPLKVLFVTHKHPPSLGGMQRQSFELIRHYRKIGEASTLHFNGSYPIWLFFVVVVPWVAIRLVMDRDIDVVHGNDGLMAVFLTPFLLTRKRIFATIHGVDVVNNSPIYQWWVRTFLRRFTGLVAVSKQTADECIARGIAPEKVIFVPNAYGTSAAAPVDAGAVDRLERKYDVRLAGRVVISSVGRAVPRKGFSWFAAQVLPHLRDDAVYVVVSPKERLAPFYQVLRRVVPGRIFRSLAPMIGMATDYAALASLAGSAALKGRIHIIAGLSDEELAQLYACSTLFVMPNLKVAGDFEGFGLVAQEAVASGALCLAADVDGIPSAIHDGETGFLLPSGDAPAWIGTIRDLCRDRRALDTKAKLFQANLRSANYGWMEMATRYWDYFERASSGTGGIGA